MATIARGHGDHRARTWRPQGSPLLYHASVRFQSRVVATLAVAMLTRRSPCSRGGRHAHAAVAMLTRRSPCFNLGVLFPLNRSRRFGSDVVDDAIDAWHFVDDAVRDA